MLPPDLLNYVDKPNPHLAEGLRTEQRRWWRVLLLGSVLPVRCFFATSCLQLAEQRQSAQQAWIGFRIS